MLHHQTATQTLIFIQNSTISVIVVLSALLYIFFFTGANNGFSLFARPRYSAMLQGLDCNEDALYTGDREAVGGGVYAE